MKYKNTFKALSWTIAGLIVSLSIINTKRVSLFGYPLLVMSLIMILIVIKKYKEERNTKK